MWHLAIVYLQNSINHEKTGGDFERFVVCIPDYFHRRIFQAGFAVGHPIEKPGRDITDSDCGWDTVCDCPEYAHEKGAGAERTVNERLYRFMF